MVVTETDDALYGALFNLILKIYWFLVTTQITKSDIDFSVPCDFFFWDFISEEERKHSVLNYGVC